MLKNLEVFSDMVFNGKDLELDSDFLGNANLSEQGYILISYNNENVYWNSNIVEEGNPPIFKDDYINVSDFVFSKLRVMKKALLDELVTTYGDSRSGKDTFFKSLKALEVVFKRLSANDFAYDNYIRKVLIELLDELLLRFENDKEVFSILNQLVIKKQTKRVINFRIKSGVKKNVIHKLYDSCVDLELIEEEVSQKDFYDIFTSNNLVKNVTLKFIVDNYTIAIFLDEIMYLYDDLNYNLVEKSGLFQNKRGKFIKATDLYTAKSRHTGVDSFQIIRFKENIKELKSD